MMHEGSHNINTQQRRFPWQLRLNIRQAWLKSSFLPQYVQIVQMVSDVVTPVTGKGAGGRMVGAGGRTWGQTLANI